MENIGVVIKALRKRKKISVAKLSNGICSAKYIYLIEKGERQPSLYILSEIFKRLHYDLHKIVPYLNYDQPLVYAEIVRQLEEARINHDFPAIEKIIKSYPKENDNQVFEQVILYNKAYIAFKRDSNCKLCHKIVKEALAITGKSVGQIDHDLSINELYLLVLYANCLLLNDQNKECVRILNNLKVIVDQNQGFSAYKDLKIVIELSLSYRLLKSKAFKEAKVSIEACKSLAFVNQRGYRLHYIYFLESQLYFSEGMYLKALKVLESALVIAADYNDEMTLKEMKVFKLNIKNAMNERLALDPFARGEWIDTGIAKISLIEDNVLYIQFMVYDDSRKTHFSEVLMELFKEIKHKKLFFIIDFTEIDLEKNLLSTVELLTLLETVDSMLSKFIDIYHFRLIDTLDMDSTFITAILQKKELWGHSNFKLMMTHNSLEQIYDMITILNN